MSFIDNLQPASFRGVPFGVLAAESSFGRRVEVHEYPFRDTPWIEDLGRATRRISFVAFLVTDSLVYGGGDVIAQREALVAACETEGAGTLIHPTLGSLTVSVPETGLVVTERWNEGRYFEVGFTFIETGERVFPNTAAETSNDANDAASATDTASADDFTADASPALEQGSAIVDQGEETAGAWGDSANFLAQDATRLFSSIAILPGNFGRYFPGGTVGFDGILRIPGAPTTLQGLIDAGALARSAVTAAGTALLGAARLGKPSDMASRAQALAASLLAATVDPAVAITLLLSLADFYPDQPTTDSVIGGAMGTMQDALGACCRRAALGALVRAAALYQPVSRDAAAALRDTIAARLDAEMLVAADAGDIATFTAMRTLLAANQNDLNTRGGALPPMKLFNFASPQPALTLAQRIYQDADRAEQLIIQADPPHPAFMPVSFSALAN